MVVWDLHCHVLKELSTALKVMFRSWDRTPAFYNQKDCHLSDYSWGFSTCNPESRQLDNAYEMEVFVGMVGRGVTQATLSKKEGRRGTCEYGKRDLAFIIENFGMEWSSLVTGRKGNLMPKIFVRGEQKSPKDKRSEYQDQSDGPLAKEYRHTLDGLKSQGNSLP